MSNHVENQEGPSEIEREITPGMLQSVFSALESKGLVEYMDSGAYIPTEGGWKLLRETSPAKEVIKACGHPDIVAKDENCFEITTNEDPKGEDNIIAVGSDKGCRDFSMQFRNAAKSARRMTITIEAAGLAETINAYGSPALRFTDANEIVVMKSDFIDGKTAAILADKSANEFGKQIKEALKDPRVEVKITFEIK